ncbi:MAG: hypothetical protein F6K39_13845 [Okeania sp. SIO3B3]|nr:hypothetical protein [Okeania sp. SIO3B3]
MSNIEFYRIWQQLLKVLLVSCISLQIEIRTYARTLYIASTNLGDCLPNSSDRFKIFAIVKVREKTPIK